MFWYKLVNGNANKLSSSLYRILLNDFLSETYEYDWISSVKSIFDNTGLSYIWTEHFVENSTWLSKAI